MKSISIGLIPLSERTVRRREVTYLTAMIEDETGERHD
jgi:hypothetical protein